MRAPVHPMGWPMEIPLPSGLVLSISQFNSLTQAMAWDAKASFSSTAPKIRERDIGECLWYIPQDHHM